MTDLSAEERAVQFMRGRLHGMQKLLQIGSPGGEDALADILIAFEAAAIERAAQVAERAAEQALATSRQGSGHGYERLGIRADAAAKIAAAIRQLHSGEGAGS